MAVPPSTPAPAPAAPAPSTAGSTATGHGSTVAHHAATVTHHAATVAHHAATVAHHAATSAHHGATGHLLNGAQSVSASSLLVQMVVGLTVIIVLIKLASRLLHRGSRPLGPGSRPPGVSVVGRQSLGKGVQVAMVTAGMQTFLLGVTQRQVTLLGEIDPGEPVVVAGDAAPAPTELELVSMANVPGALTTATATVAMGSTATGAATATNAPAWRSAIEQMRVRTVRRS